MNASVTQAPAPTDQVFDPNRTNTDYFWYATDVAGISSAAPNATTLINLDADSYFYAVALTFMANIAGAAYTESAVPQPLVKVLITDTANGKALSSAGLLIPAFMGDGKRPYRFVKPRVFKPNGTIQFSYDGSLLAAGTTYGIEIIVHGFKRYIQGAG